MFGYFRVTSQCPKTIHDHYRKYYCFVCRALEQYYGEASRCLLSFDVTVLLLLFAREGYLDKVPKIWCFGKPEQLKEALSHPIARKIATLHMLLIAAKLDDDICDEQSIAAKALQTTFFLQLSKAKRADPHMWEIIRTEYATLRDMEHQNASLEQLEQQFADLMLRLGRECFQLEDAGRLTALELASNWLYFIDAVDDIDENRKEGSFNPLAQYGSVAELKNRHYFTLAEHFQGLYQNLQALPAGSNADVIQFVLQGVIPTETMRVLLKERAAQ